MALRRLKNRPKRLTNLEITAVAFVDKGDNPGAKIAFYKRQQELEHQRKEVEAMSDSVESVLKAAQRGEPIAKSSFESAMDSMVQKIRQRAGYGEIDDMEATDELMTGSRGFVTAAEKSQYSQLYNTYHQNVTSGQFAKEAEPPAPVEKSASELPLWQLVEKRWQEAADAIERVAKGSDPIPDWVAHDRLGKTARGKFLLEARSMAGRLGRDATADHMRKELRREMSGLGDADQLATLKFLMDMDTYL